MLEVKTFSAEETNALGRKLGECLELGDLICLSGGLGAGKTAFTGGLAAGLGIHRYVTSPTFTLVNEYQGRLPLYHFDVYRLGHSEELYEIGFEEYLEGSGIVVIEWAELILEALPKEYIWVKVDKLYEDGVDARRITFEFIGQKYVERERNMII